MKHLKFFVNIERAAISCEHDVLMVLCVNKDDVTPEELERLEKLSFSPGNEYGDNGFHYRFGSC